MRIPPVKPASFAEALTVFVRQPRALMENDRLLYRHCLETSMHCEDPLLASNAFTLAHHTLRIECQSKGILPPSTSHEILEVVVREMIELGPTWDDEIKRRLKSDQSNFHTVFDGWARKKKCPALVFHNAARAFRIFELLLQPL